MLRECFAKREQEYITSEKTYANRLSALIRQHELRERNLQVFTVLLIYTIFIESALSVENKFVKYQIFYLYYYYYYFYV